jgi:uncharacterized protein (TIGR04255 family)
VAFAEPKFHDPPVVETALGVQFDNLPGYSTAHAGWYWRKYLETLGNESSLTWSKGTDAPRLEDQFERFGVDDMWGPQVAMRLLPPSQSHRTQVIRSDGERMVQIQDSRVLLNWQKRAGAYPKFGPLLEEFRTVLQAFESFVAEAGLGTLRMNQWEIAYVDQIRKGDMWQSSEDWGKIFPGLLPVASWSSHLLSGGAEAMSADWRFSLANQNGRMYVSLRQMRVPPSNEEVLSATFVARGPVTASMTWEQGLKVGHAVLNETFLGITSPEARDHWKERV